MRDSTAVITFAYLIVDECHVLEDQMASLFAGFTVSPYSLPEQVCTLRPEDVPDDPYQFEDVEDELKQVYRNANDFIQHAPQVQLENRSEEVDECLEFTKKFQHCFDEIEDNRPWVVETDTMSVDGTEYASITVKPVYVDQFLNEFVWSRADKYILSTATLPFRSNPAKWLARLGLNPEDARVISKPMPFDAANRPVETVTEIARFSQERYRQHWDEIIEKVELIVHKHDGQNGLIHTSSYDMAEELYDRLDTNAVLHESGSRDDEYYLQQWMTGDEQMLISPALKQGVDLADEECRWQVLLKVPYPGLGDPRVKYLVDEENDWSWYNDKTVRQIIQSVDRGVRHEDDYCVYYVFDRCFEDIRSRASFPAWFEDATQ